MADAYCLMMKADSPGRAEREAELPIDLFRSAHSIGWLFSQAKIPEPELRDEEAWEKGTQNPALARLKIRIRD
jgi:hypothetical protein